MSTIQRIMTKKLITISVNSNLAQAEHLMKENRIRHLPVIDEKNGIVGIITSHDLPRAQEALSLSIEFFMSSPAIYLNKDTTLKQAVYKMLENKISCILISDDKEDAIGIITTDDLLWYLVSNEEADKEGSHAIIKRILDSRSIGHLAGQLSNAGI